MEIEIRSVSYRETISFGNFQNATVEASAEVGGTHDADETIGSLKAWVRSQLEFRANQHLQENGVRMEKLRVGMDIEELKRSRDELRGDIDRLKAKWEECVAFLEAHGVDASLIDDMPF